MKKTCCVLLILSLVVTLFAGCSFSPVDYIRTKGAEVNPAAVIDKTEYTWPQAYSEVLSVCGSKYGTFTETKGKDDEVVSRSGVFFAGLFDWNSDGTPELFIGSSGKDSKSASAENFEVYSYINGKAVPVLSEKPGANAEDEENTVSLIKSDEGNIIGVSHSFSGGKKNDRSFYTFDGEKVACAKLYFGAVAEDAKVDETAEKTTAAQETTTLPEEETTAEEPVTDENGEPVTADETGEEENETTEAEETTASPETYNGSYTYFSIDGKDCTASEFNAKLNSYNSLNTVDIDLSQGADISVLSAFLSGSAPQYTDPYSGIIYASDAKAEN
ncbi:MAG: hypothetical protein IJK60_08960 [Clostridia bacterium]|nr:hypothetical protein [Clostridia bacterium]